MGAKSEAREEKSREIIDEALKVAETKKKEALLEAKEENLKARNELEKGNQGAQGQRSSVMNAGS